MTPEAYRTMPPQREHRRLMRRCPCIRGRVTSDRNRIRRILSDYNADRADLFTVRGRQACAALSGRLLCVMTPVVANGRPYCVAA